MPDDYPPQEHVLRDLGIWTEMGGEASRAGLIVTDQMLGRCGSLSTGVLGILVDVVAGGAALAAAGGGWIATSDLGITWMAKVDSGPIEARSRVLRSGKTTIVLEVRVAQATRELALATLAFSRLEARTDYQSGTRIAPSERFSFANDESGLRDRFDRVAGFEVVEESRGHVELPVRGYVGNSLGAVQGGVVTALAAYAGECACAFAQPGEVQTKDIEIHFLAPGRRGPLRTEARRLRKDEDGSVFRIEVVDAANDQRLCAMATASIGPF